MAITSAGYPGYVNHIKWGLMWPHAGHSMGVRDIGDWAVTSIPEVARGLRIAAGVGYAYGIFDESTTPVDVQAPQVTVSPRWDTVVCTRNYLTTTTTFEVVTGTTVPPVLNLTIGTSVQQPLYDVQWAVGGTTPLALVDRRMWASKVMVAADAKALRDDAPFGSIAYVGDVLWRKTATKWQSERDTSAILIPALLNGWEHYPGLPVRVMLRSGTVHMIGAVRRSTAASVPPAAILQLPVGYRPPSPVPFLAGNTGTSGYGYTQGGIGIDGTVQIVAEAGDTTPAVILTTSFPAV